MTQITIRGLDDQTHQALRRAAEKQGLSMNRYVLKLIEDTVGMSNGGRDYELEFDDLDHLAGTWSQEEFDQFQEQLQSQRAIDPEIWS